MHFFDPEVAKIVGVNAAVIYQNILFWTEKNLANGKHVHDGKVWTYNSVKALGELFPYLTASQIRTATNKLIEAGLIFEGNFNQSQYDRTKWYGVSSQIHLPKIANGFAGNDKPIPDSKPDNKPDVEDTNVSLSLVPTDDVISKAVILFKEAAEESGWPIPRVLSKARKSALSSRLKECGGIEGWKVALEKAQKSNHCSGNNSRGWVCNFDFMTRQSSFAKLMEGNYDNRNSDAASSGGSFSGASRPGRGTAEAAMAVAERLSREPEGGTGDYPAPWETS